MPLAYADIGESYIVKRVGGTAAIKKHLENLGFAPGATVKLVSRIGENVIVNVKESRVAISGELAQKILVWQARAW